MEKFVEPMREPAQSFLGIIRPDELFFEYRMKDITYVKMASTAEKDLCATTVEQLNELFNGNLPPAVDRSDLFALPNNKGELRRELWLGREVNGQGGAKKLLDSPLIVNTALICGTAPVRSSPLFGLARGKVFDKEQG